MQAADDTQQAGLVDTQVGQPHRLFRNDPAEDAERLGPLQQVRTGQLLELQNLRIEVRQLLPILIARAFQCLNGIRGASNPLAGGGGETWIACFNA